MRDRQCALNRDATELTPIVSSVINKPTTLSCVYHLSTDDLLWQNFLSPQSRNYVTLNTIHLRHSLITRLRLHMADPCTKSEVSSVSRCGDNTWGVKF